MSHEKFQSCISICLECASECNHCAFECLKESADKGMKKCIQLGRECAEMCLSTARILTIGSEHFRDVCLVCAEYCQRSAEESDKFCHLEHCRKCAEICRKCMEECLKMITKYPARK